MAKRTRAAKAAASATSPAALADELEALLARKGTRARAVHDRAYLKSADSLVHLGVTVPVMRAAVASFAREHAPFPASGDELWALVHALWDKPVFERRAAAMVLLARFRRMLVPADLAKIERLLRESKTWALVDELSANIAGPLVAEHPALAAELDRWARDGDLWIRRSAMLALLVPLRGGGGDWERFTRYADAMLGETEFFVRKAIGWVLREVSKKRPALVVEWVTPRVTRMSGVTFREAVRRLPPTDARRLKRLKKSAG